MTPASACDSSNHCYGGGYYSASNDTRAGVRSDVTIFQHTISSGFTADFVFAWLSSNNQIDAGYLVGTVSWGGTAVPAGYADGFNDGSYFHSQFACFPTVGSIQETWIKNKNVGWVPHVCGNDISGISPGLNGHDTAQPEAETEIDNSGNGCRGDYDNLKFYNAASANWNLWDSGSVLYIPLTNNPMAVTEHSDYHFSTVC